MSNYTKDNLISISPAQIPSGTLALKIGNEVFTAGQIVINNGEDLAESTISQEKNIVTITSGKVSQDKTVTIPLGSVTHEGIYVKIKEGYVEKSEITLPVVEPSLSGNVFTIEEGCVEERWSLTVPEASITETDTEVTVGVGYVPTQRVFEKSSTPELPAVSFESTDLRSGTTALNSDGEVVTGNMPDAVVGTAHMGIQSSGNRAQITVALMADTPGYLPVGYDRTIETDVGVALGYTEYTPGVEDITIPAETWLIDNQVIKGDANLIPANIKKDVTIFGITGTLDASGSGGGSSGSFAKVTEYIAPHEAYTATTSIVVSGFGEVDQWGEMVDYSAWNGTYNVTSATSSETSTEKRVFKHATESKYLFRIYDEEYGDYYWVFDTSSSCNYHYDAEFFSISLASGTWNNYEYETQVSLTLTQNTTEYPAQELVLTGVGVSGFDGYKWITDGTSNSYSGFDEVPEVGGIYAAYNGALIGKKIDVDYGITSPYKRDNHALLIMPFESINPMFDMSIYHRDCTNTGGEIGAGYSGTGWNFNGEYITVSGEDFILDGDFCYEVRIYRTTGDNQKILRMLSYDESVLEIYFDEQLCFSGELTSNTVKRTGVVPELNTWCHIALQRRGDVVSFIVDGVITTTLNYNRPVGSDDVVFEIGGKTTSNFSPWKGCMDDLRISSTARY